MNISKRITIQEQVYRFFFSTTRHASMITLLSRAIIAHIPSNKLLQPCMKICRRFIPKLPLSKTNIRMSKRDITISRQLHRTSFRFHFQQFLQNTNKIRNRNR
ncbi:hypothetical protein Hanom_Chr03g00278961 [Helianthus anomalus]